jgi:AcrR family transcriptional regulator
MAEDPMAARPSDRFGAFQRSSFSERVNGALGTEEGLRQRKKRLMRQLISDTATAMFLERGFDEVKVSEIAVACEVSEKTIYNYFPTKESLVLDMEDAMVADIREALGPGGRTSPVDAIVQAITRDVSRMYMEIDEHDQAFDMTLIRRFGEMIDNTPSLRAAQRDGMDRIARVAAEAMAARVGMDPDDPEPQIAADAILALWRVMFRAMTKYSGGGFSPGEARDLVLNEVRRAARLIDTGLWSFGMAVQGANGREQLKAAAESANEARKQVISAIKQARDAWRQVVLDAHYNEDQGHPGRPSPDLRELKRIAHGGERAARRTRPDG